MIAIPVLENSTYLSPMFGKASHVAILNIDGSIKEIITNQAMDGKDLATQLVNLQVDTFIVNHLPDHLYHFLNDLGKNIYLAPAGRHEISEVIAAYQAQQLSVFTESNARKHKCSDSNCH